MNLSIIIDFLFKGLEISAPIAFAALGAVFSEKSGVVNIALEGIMLFGAFAAAAVTLGTGSPFLGILAGVLAGAMVGALHGTICIHLRADHVISGIAINLLAASGTVLLLKVVYGTKGSSPQLGDLNLLGVGQTIPIEIISDQAGHVDIKTMKGMRASRTRNATEFWITPMPS